MPMRRDSPSGASAWSCLAVGTDNQAAVSIIEANTQGFVNNLLRKLGLGEEGLLFAFLLGSKISAAQKGDLLLKTGRRQDTVYA